MNSLALLLLLLPYPHGAQQTVITNEQLAPVEYYQLLRAAEELCARNEYARAIDLFTRLAASDPHNGRLFEWLNRCHSRLDNRQAAAEAAEQMVLLGHGNRPRTYYQVACNHGFNGDNELALQWLEKALQARFEERARIQHEPAFSSMKDDPRFAALAGLLPDREFTREEGWTYDLQFFADEVERLSVDEDLAAKSKTLRAEIQDVIQRLPALSNEQVAFEIQQLAASLGNGHTMVYPMPSKRVQFSLLPIQLYFFEDGLFVVGGTGPGSELIGSKVLKIGTKNPATLLEDLKPIVHRDNEHGMLWMGPLFLAIPEVLHFIGAIEDPAQVEIEIERRDGTVETVRLYGGPMSRPGKLGPAGPANDAPLYLQNVDDAYWFRVLQESSAIYVQYNQVINKPGQPVEEFAQTLRAAIDEARPTNLIVDLRHNNGGDPDEFQPLVRPLVYFEMLQPGNRLYIITGRNTFSAAQNFLNAVESVTSPVIAGEPSSGRPNSIGEESEVELPWSGLRMSIACRYWQDSTPTDMRPWIPPHIPVRLTSADWFANRDPVMEAIRQIIQHESGGE